MKKSILTIILIALLLLTGCSKSNIPDSLVGRWEGDFHVIILRANGEYQYKHLLDSEEDHTGNYTYNEIENTITLNVCTEKKNTYRTREYCEKHNKENYTYYFNGEMLEKNFYKYKKTN